MYSNYTPNGAGGASFFVRGGLKRFAGGESNKRPDDWEPSDVDPLAEIYADVFGDDRSDEWDTVLPAAPLPLVPLPGDNQPITDSAKRLGDLLAKRRTHFTRGGAVVRFQVDESGNPTTQPVKPAEFMSDLEKVAILVKVAQTKDGPVEIQTTCSEQKAKAILGCQDFKSALPRLTIISRCPVLIEREGELRMIVGYDEASGIFAQGSPPGEMEVAEASQLLNSMLADFQFATPSDRSRALASLITPALNMGGLLPKRAPLDLSEADDSQTGKGFRNKLTAAIYNQKSNTITQQKAGVGSLEEAFDKALVAGKLFISIDNVRGKIDSPKLESFLTEDTYNARAAYTPNMEIDPRGVYVMFTSNKADVTPDLAKRCSCVRILKQLPGFKFTTYPEGDILDRVRAQQPQYLGAVFAIVRAWYSAGKPTSTDTRHDFREWARTLDWIVQNLLDAKPLLDGHQETQERMTNPSLNWLRDVMIVVMRQGRAGEWLKAADILDCIDEDGRIEIPGLRDNTSLEDGVIHKQVLQQMGKRLKTCFREAGDLAIDGLGIARQKYTDEQYRERFQYVVYRLGDEPEGVPF